MRVLLDTNVLLRAIEPGHVHHATSVAAVDALQRAGHDLLLVPQVLYEFWVVATRPIEQNGLGLTADESMAELAALQRFFRLLRDERAVYVLWERLVATLGVIGKQAHDARLAAAMQRHAISHILTFNISDFRRYPSLAALSPADVASGAIKV